MSLSHLELNKTKARSSKPDSILTLIIQELVVVIGPVFGEQWLTLALRWPVVFRSPHLLATDGRCWELMLDKATGL